MFLHNYYYNYKMFLYNLYNYKIFLAFFTFQFYAKMFLQSSKRKKKKEKKKEKKKMKFFLGERRNKIRIK